MFNSERFKIFLALVICIAGAVAFWFYPLRLGLDLQGGTRLILEAEDSKAIKVDNDAILGVIRVIQNRIDSLGVNEPIIRQKGIRQIIVELPGVKDPERAIHLIGDTALLEFVEAEWAPFEAASLPPEKLELLSGPGAKLAYVEDHSDKGQVTRRPIFLKKTALTGAHLKSAAPSTDQYGRPIVNIEFKSDGAQLFAELTSKMVGKPIAIVLDGKIISAPNVNEPITGGKAQISGHFSIEEMKDLVIKLKAGALPVPVKLVSKSVVGPTLGKDSIEKSKVAGVMSLVVIGLFMIGYYRWPGLIANIALLFYVFLSIAALKTCHATLTLTGIAGLILSIGMAVDTNIIIFERIKEEKREGASTKVAIEHGFKRAFLTVLDSHISTLVAAGVLFWLGTGSIRGFAVTLSIGAVVSMLTAVLMTRLLLQGTNSLFENKGKELFK